MLYDDELPLKERIECISKRIYGADGAAYAIDADDDGNITGLF